MEQEPNSSGSGLVTQEKLQEFNAWMEDAKPDDDIVPDDKILLDFMYEVLEEYHLDQMKNYLKSDIVWESRKERLTLQTKMKKAPVVLMCQRDPKAPALDLLNQDLFYLKKGNVRPTKYTLSLHKFPVVLFPDDDMEERTSIATVIWERVHDFQLGMESYQQKVNLTALKITFPGIEHYDIFEITSEPIVGMIYENSKGEKRVIMHKDIHKFCDATLKRVLEKLESYNKDVKHEYADPSPTKNDVEHLCFYENDIRERLQHRGQMRRWEMYVNGRPLGPRRDRLEQSTFRGRLLGLKKCRL
ncbi:hypothetical protein Tco_0536645 [Tanacetum coccineum]